MSTDGRYAVFAGSKKQSPKAQTAFPLFRWTWESRIARSHWAKKLTSSYRKTSPYLSKLGHNLFIKDLPA